VVRAHPTVPQALDCPAIPASYSKHEAKTRLLRARQQRRLDYRNLAIAPEIFGKSRGDKRGAVQNGFMSMLQRSFDAASYEPSCENVNSLAASDRA
jgi:hypothetical protein